MGQPRDAPRGSQFEHNYPASVGTCAAETVNPATKLCSPGIVPVMGCDRGSGRALGLPAGLIP
jgi:hypothetical protein